MNKIHGTIINLVEVISDWCSSHASQEGWASAYAQPENFNRGGLAIGNFDWFERTAEKAHEQYNWVKCESCGVIDDTCVYCDCEESNTVDVSLDEFEEWLADIEISEGSSIWYIAEELLEEEGYKEFVETYGLEECVRDSLSSLEQLNDIEDARDALVWLLKAAHVSHYSGRHLERCVGWTTDYIFQLCDNGPYKFFGQELCEDFMSNFNLEDFFREVEEARYGQY